MSKSTNNKPSPTLVPAPFTTDSQASIRNLNDWRSQWMSAANNPNDFWLTRTKELLSWHTPPTLGCQGDFRTVEQNAIQWFADGKMNVSYNCVDRHLADKADQTAMIWEADEIGEGVSWTYRELHQEVCRAANGLESLGVQAGDRVMIYMGMVPQAAVAMLACARIGAIHSVVFGGFSSESLRDRIIDCQAEYIISQDYGFRGGKTIALKSVVDEALQDERCVCIKHVLLYQRTNQPISLVEGRDVVWKEIVDTASDQHKIVAFDAEHPLFILYTSGSTGKPKGLLHTSAGYLTYTAWTHRTVFELRAGDVYACVADVGWITGHSYIVYGPLANGCTTLMFESTPNYPTPGRYWDLVQRHKVSLFYTAPTAIRALAAQGDEWVTQYDLSSLRVLGTVGEPINPEAWHWYHQVVGQKRCAIVDTWWQTETGGMCIAPIAGVSETQAGSATLPLPGIQPYLLNTEGHIIHGIGEGRLCLAAPWPGQARTIWGDHTRFVQTYFSEFPGFYFTGDGCRRDLWGHYWITGRVDDVINVAGHRMGTAEFEAVLITDKSVAEAAVVGFPHAIKGQGVCAYVVLPSDVLDEGMTLRLIALTRKIIGVHAKLDRIISIPALPKTRSGKVMRRILRKVAANESEQLGDISTLADPHVVTQIINAAKVN